MKQKNSGPSHFIYKCLNDTLDGIREGLSHYSGASRVAAVIILHPKSDVYILDPQNLLRGHEPKLKELYIDNNDWLVNFRVPVYKKRFGHLVPEKNLQLAGLISQGGRSKSVYYQMWFSEHHPDMCSISPTECWLEHAAWRFSNDLMNDPEIYTGISGSFLSEYATHAVRDYIVDRMNMVLGWDSALRVYPILDAVLEISRTREEGAWPRGRLLFTEPRRLGQIDFIARFPEKETPLLDNAKHVCKLLISVEQSDRILVSEGKHIIGIANGKLPDFCIVADFRGQYGYMQINNEAVCSFSDGRFQSTTHRAKLVQVEEALLESDLDSDTSSRMFQAVKYLVHHAEEQRFGCTLVVDLNWTPVNIAGQRLDKVLDLNEPCFLDLAKSLLKMDGAVHISRDVHLIGFACLLDGLSVPGEDRARGARFNSALRFTAAHPNLFVIVVSADRPVSVIQEGIEISAQCQYKPIPACEEKLQRLSQWIFEGNGY